MPGTALQAVRMPVTTSTTGLSGISANMCQRGFLNAEPAQEEPGLKQKGCADRPRRARPLEGRFQGAPAALLNAPDNWPAPDVIGDIPRGAVEPRSIPDPSRRSQSWVVPRQVASASHYDAVFVRYYGVVRQLTALAGVTGVR